MNVPRLLTGLLIIFFLLEGGLLLFIGQRFSSTGAAHSTQTDVPFVPGKLFEPGGSVVTLTPDDPALKGLVTAFFPDGVKCSGVFFPNDLRIALGADGTYYLKEDSIVKTHQYTYLQNEKSVYFGVQEQAQYFLKDDPQVVQDSDGEYYTITSQAFHQAYLEQLKREGTNPIIQQEIRWLAKPIAIIWIILLCVRIGIATKK